MVASQLVAQIATYDCSLSRLIPEQELQAITPGLRSGGLGGDLWPSTLKDARMDLDRLLVVSSSGAQTRRVLSELRHARYHAVHAATVDQALAYLDRHDVTFMIVDYEMLRHDGTGQLWAPMTCESAPLIVMVARERLRDAAGELQKWAYDFVCKPVQSEELLARCAIAQSRKQQQDNLYDQATRDPLTRLYNRRYFMDNLVGHLYARVRGVGGVSLILADIDNFKRVNDQHGHLVGDDVLTTIGEIFLSNTRRGDTCGRYGGEEFVISCPHGTLSDCWELAERLRNRIADDRWEGLPEGLHITASFGVAGFDPTCMDHTVSSLIAAADQAMMKAKRLGKNRTQVYTHGSAQQIVSRQG